VSVCVIKHLATKVCFGYIGTGIEWPGLCFGGFKPLGVTGAVLGAKVAG